jgi:putative endonuclease
MKKYKQALGSKGERLALNFLHAHGYKILMRNFSCRFGEIDIIARQGKTTVFIEVKTRSSTEFGQPQDSIGPDKIKHIFRCAQFYIKNNGYSDEEFRFDIISIVLTDKPKIELIRNAFP